jgi:hypothetical protein
MFIVGLCGAAGMTFAQSTCEKLKSLQPAHRK